MNSIELFTLALGLEKPWIITKTDIDPSIPQLDIHIDFDSTSYTQLKEHVHSHTASVIPHQELPNVLLWVHTAISNAKRQLLDVYYKMKPEYLQYDLNQFCYKFNRRYFGEKQFDRLLIAAVTYTPYFKSRIYNRNRCG